MMMELSCFFPVPERGKVALENLKAAGFDVHNANIVTGEDARNSLHARLAAARKGRAAAGAVVSGVLSAILAVILMTSAAGFPWLFILSFIALSVVLGAAIGGYYGMGVEKESVLVGFLVPRDRIREAVGILRLAGGKLITAQPVHTGHRPTWRRGPTMIVRHQ